MEHIKSSAPTPVLLRYFEGSDESPPSPPGSLPPLKMQIKNWKRDWKKLEDIIKQEQPTPHEFNELQRSVECRRQIIRDLKRGKGTRIHKELGIVLNFLNIGGIEAVGNTAIAINRIYEADAKQAVEMRERRSERTNTQTRTKLAREMSDKLPDISDKEALEAVQLEAKITTKDIKENKTTVAVDPKTLEILSTILGVIVSAVKKDRKDA